MLLILLAGQMLSVSAYASLWKLKDCRARYGSAKPYLEPGTGSSALSESYHFRSQLVYGVRCDIIVDFFYPKYAGEMWRIEYRATLDDQFSPEDVPRLLHDTFPQLLWSEAPDGASDQRQLNWIANHNVETEDGSWRSEPSRSPITATLGGAFRILTIGWEKCPA